jgi:DNA helicase-2/ATP-dependent DNA helicase PcrA
VALPVGITIAVIAIHPADEFSEEQRAALTHDGGNAYVAAGPGTGKTHLLVGRYVRLLDREVARERIVVLTFSRRAADELRTRIVQALENSGRSTAGVEVRTFHGFASRLLQGEGARFHTRRLLDGFTRQLLLDAALASTSMPSLGTATKLSRSFRSEATRFLDDLGRASEGALEAVTSQASPRLTDLIGLRDALARSRDCLGASDLNDLVSRAVRALGQPGSEAARWVAAHRYEHVLVDEFQDTDVVQLNLLEALGATIFAVGDEAQSIYRFRGAQHGIVAAAVERLGMRRFALTVSRRCPPDVCALAAATPFVGSEALRSAREDGAPVEVVALRTTADEVHYVADRVEAALDAGTAPNEIAVLLRTTRPFGPLVADELRRRSIAVVENSHDALLADNRVSTLRAAFDVLSDPGSETAWRRLMTAQPLGFDPLAVRLQRKAFATFRPDVTLEAALTNAGLQSPIVSNRDLTAALVSAQTSWDAGDLGRAARSLARGLRLVPAILRSEPPAAVRAASARLRAFCDGLADAQRALVKIGTPATCAEIVAAIDEHLPALAGDTTPQTSAVRILTVHGAKGLEFEFVVMADAVDGRFPQHARASTLLSEPDRTLLIDSGIDGASVTDAVEQEEASLWFVAATRTKTRLLITFPYEGLDGGAQRPSRFLTGRVPETATHVARDSLEIAALRNGDPAWRTQLRSDQRIAASPSLSSYAAEGDAAFRFLDTRPIALPQRLSVSNAIDWLQCPRKIFYSRFAGLRSDESTAMTIGNALHLVLQRFHERETDFGNVVDADAGRWTTALHELRRAVWSETEFEAPAIQEACAIFADRVLAGYARALAKRASSEPFVVERNESDVDVPLGPTTLRGRIDRFDRRLSDGALVLVDYKSGSAKERPFAEYLRKAEPVWASGASVAGTTDHGFAAQLAFYASALQNVGGFEYVYLKGAKGARMEVAVDATTFDAEMQRLVGLLVADIREHLSEPLARGELLTLPPALHKTSCRFCNYERICPGPAEDHS